MSKKISPKKLNFIKNAIESNIDECIIWPFGVSTQGYPRIAMDLKDILVPSFVCEKVYGPKPIDKDECAHNCGIRKCINWKHLRWATYKENDADKLIHGKDNRGEKHYRSKLNEEQVIGIRKLRGILTQQKIARMYNVSSSTIQQIMDYRNWYWLEEKEKTFKYKGKDLFK